MNKNYLKSIILIPTLNEKDNLDKLIPEIFSSMPDISVLIVDDNSTDETGELMIKLQKDYDNLFFLQRKGDFGYGRACIAGFSWILDNECPVSIKSVVTMDADFSHDYSSIPNMIQRLSDFDVIIGSRYIKNGGIKNWSLHRKILSKMANLYVRFILRMPIRDITSGFNAYGTEVLRKIDLRGIKSDGYAFLVELKYRLFKSGARIIEQPIIFQERREGQSKMSRQVILESIQLPWKLRFGE